MLTLVVSMFGIVSIAAVVAGIFQCTMSGIGFSSVRMFSGFRAAIDMTDRKAFSAVSRGGSACT